MWQQFIDVFCEIQFLCDQGGPNWLGWAVMSFGAFVVVMVIITKFWSSSS